MKMYQFRVRSMFPTAVRAIRYGLCLLLGCLLVAWLPGSAHAIEGPIGRSQRIVVVTCKYFGTEDPALSAQDWAEELNDRLNAYYETATRRAAGQLGMTTFRFIAVPGVCEFDYTYEDTAPGGSASILPAGAGFDANNDPQVRVREVRDAGLFAASQVPTVFDSASRILVVVNRSKRAVGMTYLPLPFPLSLSYSLISKTSSSTTVSESDISLVAHEIGHQVGLPDLYAYNGGPSPIGSWGLMGSHSQQNFVGQSRRLTGWLSNDQELTIARPLFGQVQRTVRLHVPGSAGGTNNVELIRLPFDPTGLTEIVGGYLVEARPKIGLDESRSGLGLPSNYNGGVLVTKVNRFLSPDIAQPLIGIPVVEVQHAGNIERAGLQAGEQFTDPDTGLTVQVLSQNGEESFDLQITWGEDNWPDLQAFDLWVDHPDNGVGTFMMPGSGPFNDPSFFGDLPAGRTEVTLLPPGLRTVAVTHRLFARVRNLGNVEAPNVTGTLHILRPVLPATFNPSDPASFLPLQTTRRTVNFGNIAAGGSAARFVNVTLDGAIAVVLIVDELDGEPNAPNNTYFELFPPGVSITPGSPYPETVTTFQVANSDPFDHVAMPVVHDLPEGWSVSATPTFAYLPQGKETQFKLTIQPPDPRYAKPGTFEAIDTVAWINADHSLLPVTRFPAYVLLNHRTRLVLTVESVTSTSAVVTARFTFFDLNGAESPVSGERIALAVNGEDGSRSALYATTDSGGKAIFKVSMKSGVKYGVVGQYVGSTRYAPAVSEAEFIEQQLRPSISRLYPSALTATGKPAYFYVIGSNFTRSSSVLVNGKAHKTRYYRSTLLLSYLDGSETAKATTHKVAVRDGGLTSNSVLLPVTSVKIGASELTLESESSLPMAETSFSITWTHPISNWRALDTLDLRLVDDGEIAAWVRFTEAFSPSVRSATNEDASYFSLLDGHGQVVGSGKAGEDLVLETDSVQLILERTSFAGSGAGPDDRSLTLHMTLLFKQAAAGRSYSTEIYVTDDALVSQGPEIGDPFTVLGPLYLPQVSR